MSKERELLKECRLMLDNPINGTAGRNLQIRITELLTQPEQEPSVKLPDSENEAVMMNLLSDNWLRHHAPHRLNQPEQEPVAWITEWVQRYRHNDTPIMDRAVSFTKGDAPAVPNPNYIPLYTSPPKREPLSDEEIYTRCCAMGGSYTCNFIDGVEWAEHQHGIRSFDDE